MKLTLPSADDGILVMLKLPGERCNINCHYCYERRKPYDNPVSLEPEVLQRFLDRCGTRPLSVMLHGGEPLLVGRQRMARLLEVLRAYPGPVTLSMQTNGIMLDDRWLDFFDHEWPDIEIGISIDGDSAGSAHRVDFADRPTYPLVVRALERLGRRGRNVGVIVVVTRLLLGRASEVLDSLTAHPCVRVVKLSSCLDFNVVSKDYNTPNRRSLQILNPTGEGMPGWATTPAEYAAFLAEAFDHWVASRLFDRVLIEPFFSIIRSVSGQPNAYTGYSERKEPFILTLYPDGRIGSSDELSMPGALLGTVDGTASIDDLLSLRSNEALHRDLSGLLRQCAGCSHESTCRGGALPDRLRFAGSGFEESYCDSRKATVDHVSAAMSAVPA
ncbi:anaerobic sulfatase-maturating enzyme homolog AslB [Pilimelia terevasa]|uniref:Anaerobic sulfatase-maturating enzyme homolog AslB n=1 Tax=Pilimelia terevasa TaxID=53372 RepID=A0A8J3FED3_9ACTN|nr:radical SAM protein [Pilimelia terevasa]GGK16309.1 anaerobic sulfatase-maturating enzyme homolog AslB [Pilimelia terevasa]